MKRKPARKTRRIVLRHNLWRQIPRAAVVRDATWDGTRFIELKFWEQPIKNAYPTFQRCTLVLEVLPGSRKGKR